MSFHAKLLNKKHMSEALHRAKFKFPGDQVTPTSPRSGDLPSLIWMNLEIWQLESNLSWLAVRLNTFLIVAPLGQMDKWWVVHSWQILHHAVLTHAPPIKPTSYPRKNMENKSQIRGKYLQNMSIKEIIPSIYKEQKHNKNTNNPIKRRAKYLNRHFKIRWLY